MAAARPPSGSGLPADLVPPLKVALARAVTRMPRAAALPGSLSYEPKWDGYRCVAIHDNQGVTLWSRQGKELTGYFPELTAALASDIPPGCVVDGEAVIRAGGRLDFSALQQRLGAGRKTLPGLVRQTPARYVAFDVLAVAGHDARALPLSQRRALLEELARGWAPPLSLSPATTDPDEAATWFEDLPHTGMEGWSSKATTSPTHQGPVPG
jgi:ATP-dependent DNA ligase